MGGLGRVVQNETGLAALRAGSSIDGAQSAIQAKGLPTKDKIKNHLKASASAIHMASVELEKEKTLPKDAEFLVDKLLIEVSNLQKVLKKLRK